MLLVGSMLLVHGTLGIRLEHRADDYAASTVGADALRRSLEKLAELNMLQRRTGWLWNTLQQHPGLNSRMERLGSPPGDSDSTNPWIYLVAAPIVLVMAVALVNDPGRIGEVSGAADMSAGVYIVIALVMTALMGGVWALSRFRYRTVVVLFQIAVVWVGGLLHVIDVRNHVSWWDLAEDGVLLVSTLLQLVPGGSLTLRRRVRVSTRRRAR